MTGSSTGDGSGVCQRRVRISCRALCLVSCAAIVAVVLAGFARAEVDVAELQKSLQSSDGNTRRKAAELLGELGTGEAVVLLAEAYRAEAQDAFGVKAACAEALGRTGQPAAAEPLAEMLRDPDYWVRKTAAGALAHIPGERTKVALDGAAADRDPRVRAEAVLALGVRGEDWPTVEAALRDPDDRVVAAAVQAFAAPGAPGAQAVLTRALASSSWRVRYRAASALAHLGDPRGREVLTQGVREGQHVAAALREAGEAGEAAVPFLAELYRAPSFPEKERVLSALEAIEGVASTAFFLDLADDGTAEAEDRVRGISVLYDRRQELSAGQLARVAGLLAATDPNLVAVSLQILADGEGSRHLAAIAPLARHENQVVRHFALVNLAAFGGQDLEPVFLAALADTNGANVRLALEALGRVGTSAALPALRPLLQETRLRRYAQAAIEAIEARP